MSQTIFRVAQEIENVKISYTWCIDRCNLSSPILNDIHILRIKIDSFVYPL